jgi:hypothetical protein
MPATTPPPPRRNWHLARWFLVLAIAVFGWSGWQAYAFRYAIKEAKALGWIVQYNDPLETIRKNWKAAFKKETWPDGVIDLTIPTSESFEQHTAIARRLNPQELLIQKAPTLRDLWLLKHLTRLQSVGLEGCTGLTNVEVLRACHELPE